MPRNFHCAVCHGEYVSAWSDDEMLDEASTFTPDELSDSVLVCEDCWRAAREAVPQLDERYER